MTSFQLQFISVNQLLLLTIKIVLYCFPVLYSFNVLYNLSVLCNFTAVQDFNSFTWNMFIGACLRFHCLETFTGDRNIII